MKTFKAFIKPFKAPQRSVTKNLSWFSPLRPESGQEGLTKKISIEELGVAFIRSWFFICFSTLVWQWQKNLSRGVICRMILLNHLVIEFQLEMSQITTWSAIIQTDGSLMKAKQNRNLSRHFILVVLDVRMKLSDDSDINGYAI